VTVLPDSTFQATDLARRAREVMEAARRPGGALIRDKDGTAFSLSPAGGAGRMRYTLAGLRDAVRVLRLLSLAAEVRDPVLYGDLAWAAALPDPEQVEFAWEYIRALESIPSTGVEAVEQLLYDWQQTARIFGDEGLRVSLGTDLDSPLDDVEL
jgi:hypothetical protein